MFATTTPKSTPVLWQGATQDGYTLRLTRSKLAKIVSNLKQTGLHNLVQNNLNGSLEAAVVRAIAQVVSNATHSSFGQHTQIFMADGKTRKYQIVTQPIGRQQCAILVVRSLPLELENEFEGEFEYEYESELWNESEGFNAPRRATARRPSPTRPGASGVRRPSPTRPPARRPSPTRPKAPQRRASTGSIPDFPFYHQSTNKSPDKDLCAFFALRHFFYGKLEQADFMKKAIEFYKKMIPGIGDEAHNLAISGNDPALIKAFVTNSPVNRTEILNSNRYKKIILPLKNKAHFITILKVKNGTWWNYDSLLSEPQMIQDLSAFLNLHQNQVHSNLYYVG